MSWKEIVLKEEFSYNIFNGLCNTTILDEEVIAEATIKSDNFGQAKEVLDMIEWDGDEYPTVDQALEYIKRYD